MKQVLSDYVHGGFRSISSVDGTDTITGIKLNCPPQYEANCYNGAQYLTTFDNQLSQLNMPVVIITGKEKFLQPSFLGGYISRRIGDNSKLVRWNHCGHFGPLEKPHEFADFIADFHKS